MVGIDNIAEGSYVAPSLTTIAPDLGTLAEQALTLLEDQMSSRRPSVGARPPRQEWSPFRLVVRESTVES